jgi:hypothetical protein
MAVRKVRKKTAFVPRSLFATAVGVTVVPLCVSACGGNTTSTGSSGLSSGSSGSSAGASGIQLTVAASGFLGVAASGFFAVSGVAFGGSGSGAASGGASGVATSGILFTVAASGFLGVAASGFLGVAQAGFVDAGPDADAGVDDARAPEGGSDAKAHDARPDALLLSVANVGFDATTGPRDADKG